MRPPLTLAALAGYGSLMSTLGEKYASPTTSRNAGEQPSAEGLLPDRRSVSCRLRYVQACGGARGSQARRRGRQHRRAERHFRADRALVQEDHGAQWRWVVAPRPAQPATKLHFRDATARTWCPRLWPARLWGLRFICQCLLPAKRCV